LPSIITCSDLDGIHYEHAKLGRALAQQMKQLIG
jgi:hypothetical protein